MIRALVMAAAAASLGLGACATGQSSSFATRVGASSAQSAEAGETDDERAAAREPNVLASSGNVLLPGAFSFPPPGSQLLAGLDPAPLSGTGLTAIAAGAVDVTLSGPNGTAVSVDANGALTGLGGSPLLSSLAPVASGLAPATSAPSPLTGAAQTAGPLTTIGAQGVSVAGQPLASLAGAGPVLGGVGSAAGAAGGGVGSLASGVAPTVSTVVNAAGQAVATTPPPSAGAPAQPVPGLGGLGALLPRVR